MFGLGAITERLSALQVSWSLQTTPRIRSSPPAAGFTNRAACSAASERKNAIHFPSGDHLGKKVAPSSSVLLANRVGTPPLNGVM